MRGGTRRKSGHAELRHPRTIFAFRVLLYLTLVVVLGMLAVSAAGTLLVVAGLGGFALLAGTGPETSSLVGLAVVGVGLPTAFGAGALLATRWIDAQVVENDRRPDPVERLRRRYLAAEIDEREFERELDRLFRRRATEVRRSEFEREYGRTADREYERR